MWSPMHQRPSMFVRRQRRQPRMVQEVPSIFLPMPETEELHRQNETFDDLEIGHCCMQGWRASMEDQYVIEQFPDLKDHYLVAVFDGHSGTFAAEYAASELRTKIMESDAWKAYTKATPTERKDQGTKLGEALLHAYLQIDDDLRSLLNQGHMDDSGCTAVSVLITPTHLICANVGDSRAVVGALDKTISLTDDHKPENPEERQRIEDAGGFVADNRVNGQLAMSRALGDFMYKTDSSLPMQKQLVVPIPDLSIRERNADEDQFLVVACDGVWDAMSNDDAIVFLQDYFMKPTSFSINDYVRDYDSMLAVSKLQRESERRNGEDANAPSRKRRRTDAAEESTSSSSESDSDESESSDSKEHEQIPTAVNAASALISVALAKGSMDNISAIVVKFPAAALLSSENTSTSAEC